MSKRVLTKEVGCDIPVQRDLSDSRTFIQSQLCEFRMCQNVIVLQSIKSHSITMLIVS